MKKKPVIVILTHDRPNILYRCINTTMKNNKIASHASWLIIDDSNENFSVQNSSILEKYARNGLTIFHIKNEIREKISRILSQVAKNNQSRSTFAKTSDRDISGLRNIGLLLSQILKSSVTFFIDDDVVTSNADKRSFLDHVFLHYKHHRNYIIGAKLVGILDESYIGRVAYLLNRGKRALLNQYEDVVDSKFKWIFKKNPLWTQDDATSHENPPTHTSAGLIAVNLDSKSVMPFAAGYNEDWIWCLLQSVLNNTKIVVERVQAFHSPPSIFHPDEKEILWEQLGDIMFESLLATAQNENISDIKKIWKLAKKHNTLQNYVIELLEIIQSLDALIKNTKNMDERQQLVNYLAQSKKTLRSLKKIKINDVIDTWFQNFNKRRLFFSFILNKKELSIRINDVLKEAKIH